MLSWFRRFQKVVQPKRRRPCHTLLALEGLEERYLLTASITEYPVPLAGGLLQSITVGADGALWFTANAAGKIGKITTTGVVTEYPISTTDPEGITSGPDGALWFTPENVDKIGRIGTDGIVTFFSAGGA